MADPVNPDRADQTRIVIGGGRDLFKAIRPNPLRNYASSTYSIKFGFMTPDMLRSFVNDGRYDGLDKNILMASGGVEKANRQKYFDVDFYLEDLEIEGVIGLNSITRSANATMITFRIVEPNGFTFFNRIYYLCQDIRVPNYLNIPYFLKIRFQGWDDIENSHKYKTQSPEFVVPIMLTQVRATVSPSGGEYQVEAVPYYDSALHDRSVTVKSETSVEAKDLKGFFDELATSINDYNRDTNNKNVRAVDNNQTGDQFYDTIKFEIDQEIAKSTFLNQSVSSTATMSNSPQGQLAAGVPGGRALPVPLSRVAYRIPNGSNIVDIVDNVIKTSSYIVDQRVDAGKLKEIEAITDKRLKEARMTQFIRDLERPLGWYKIRPEAKLKGFNLATRQYAKEIIYRIKVYKIYNGRDSNFPGWGETLPVKRYDYIFTGKNEDILDFAVKFDNLYHLIVLANANKNQLTSGRGSSEATRPSMDEDSKDNPKLPPGYANNPGTGAWPFSYVPVTSDAARGTYTSGSQEKLQEAAVLSTNVITGAAGDMISIDLDIIGDPE
jgi:hypothetical protein